MTATNEEHYIITIISSFMTYLMTVNYSSRRLLFAHLVSVRWRLLVSIPVSVCMVNFDLQFRIFDISDHDNNGRFLPPVTAVRML